MKEAREAERKLFRGARDKGIKVGVERTLVLRLLADLEMLIAFAEMNLPSDDQKAKLPDDLRQILDHAAARVMRAVEHMKQLAEQAGIDLDEDLDD